MGEPETEADRLRQDLSDADEAFWKQYADLAFGWQFTLGPMRVRRYASPMFIAQVFVLFHVLCFSIGAALIFATGPARELGIVMVIGSIFAFGSFVGQFWVTSYQRATEISRIAIGDQETLSLRQLAARREEIVRRINELEEIDRSGSSQKMEKLGDGGDGEVS